MTRTNRFLLDSVHRAESQRVIHRFIPSFVGSRPRFRWNNRHPHVLLLCASEVERRKKHGTPATSVAGVYSFLGRRLFHKDAGSAFASLSLSDRSGSGYL